ncbi:MAG: TPR end-of-group domain-containing protein [Thermoanaerobaculia bacterium]
MASTFVPGLCDVLALLAAITATEAPRPGHVAERVRCHDRPSFSYALYLPSRPPTGRKIPLLVLLDARGRALVPLSLFLPAAEERNWALASAWDSRSDADPGPTTEAWEAIRRDAIERFDVDERRIYVAGFSGTARLATLLGLTSPRPPAGVIACGAGFAEGFPPKKEIPFPWFGTAGNRDFNHDEMLEIAASLEALGIPHRLVVFDGGHEWAPPHLAADALHWVELQAIRRGLAPMDSRLVAQMAATGSAEARRDEATGDVLAALRRWDGLARDFSGVSDIGPFEREAARLKGSLTVRRQESAEGEKLEERRRTIPDWARKLRRALAAPTPYPVEKLVSELGVQKLQKKANSKRDRDEALAAERLLSALLVQTSFYLPQERRSAGDFRGAALVLGVAEAIRPGDPEVLYALASARAQAGEDGAAIEALRKAVAAGFCDQRRLETDPDLVPLRWNPAFAGLLETVLH